MCDQCWSSCCTFSDGVRNKNTNACALLLLRTARYKDARRHNTYMLSLGNPVRLLATRCLRSDRHLVPGTCFAAFCGADCAALCLRLLLGDMLWLSELGMCCSDVCRSRRCDNKLVETGTRTIRVNKRPTKQTKKHTWYAEIKSENIEKWCRTKIEAEKKAVYRKEVGEKPKTKNQKQCKKENQEGSSKNEANARRQLEGGRKGFFRWESERPKKYRGSPPRKKYVCKKVYSCRQELTQQDICNCP